jgi:AraC-like DNA-binding protein
VLGIGLLPLGLSRLLDVPAASIANRHLPLADFWGEDATRLERAVLATTDPDAWAHIIDDVLLARLATAPAAHPLVAAGHRALVEGHVDTVEAFAAQLGISVRKLQRLSAPLFGFGPKTLLRRQRFLRTLDAVQKAPPGAVLAEHLGLDYADQSHFVHEFRAFMGMAPGEYLRLPREVMRRAAAEREALMGETMQVLQVPR